MKMELYALKDKDYLWHGPTDAKGFLEDVEDCGTFVKLKIDGEWFNVTQDGFDMWWNVERDEVQIHYQSCDNAALKQGVVRALPTRECDCAHRDYSLVNCTCPVEPQPTTDDEAKRPGASENERSEVNGPKEQQETTTNPTKETMRQLAETAKEGEER